MAPTEAIWRAVSAKAELPKRRERALAQLQAGLIRKLPIALVPRLLKAVCTRLWEQRQRLSLLVFLGLDNFPSAVDCHRVHIVLHLPSSLWP